MAENGRQDISAKESRENDTLESILASGPETLLDARERADSARDSGEDADRRDTSEEAEAEDMRDDAGGDEAPGDSDDESSETLEREIARAEKGFKNAQRFLIYLILFLAVAWVLFFKIIGITHMPSEDMEPRVDAGDLLVFYRLDKTPGFQDVVVFEKDAEGNGAKTLFVGRVMAAPGDTVDINENNRLVVNGNVIAESASYYSATFRRGERVSYPLTLAEGEYFILSDNRNQGTDSRYFGPVSEEELLGTVITLLRRNKL